MTESTDNPSSKVGQRIRCTTPNHFRAGQWASVKAAVWVRARLTWLVEFPDGAADLWDPDDVRAGYEFRPAGEN